jgi:competence protein ComEC
MARVTQRVTEFGVSGRPSTGWRRWIVDRLRQSFVLERARWALWIPVFLGCGITLYFALDHEPPPWAGPAGTGVALAGVLCARRRPAMLLVAWAVTLAAIGFTAAQLQTARIAAPVLERKLGPVTIEARVGQVEMLTRGRRIWLDEPIISRLSPDRTPARIRVKLAGTEPALQPGDRIGILAILHPPAAPAAPGAFDFARRAYFLQLGAVGYAIRAPELLERPDRSSFALRVEALRQRITERIQAALPGPVGAVAAALMTGDRGAIPEDVLSAMRDSGLAHLLAISGLHMGLVGGLIFFAVRLVLAAWERVALRHPIKKWAAAVALLGSFGYLMISGATVPTQRAFLMLCFVMLAVMIDRLPISMNLVAWAAGVILLITPDSLMSVSFQMSFGAVVALVAVYETTMATRLGRGGRDGFVRRAWFYLGAVLLTTLVSGFATAPFALFHFNRVANYSMLANFVAVPLTALWVMPCAIAAFILMPFGLDSLALRPMGLGIEGVVASAKFVQALPGAAVAFPAMPSWALGAIVLGGLWLCLWGRRWRALGMVPVVAGLGGAFLVETPDILIGESGKIVAVRQADGQLAFAARPRGFVAETWLRRSGVALPADSGKALPVPLWPAERCDGLGCVVETNGHIVAIAHRAAALTDDCGIATILVSRVPVWDARCKGPKLIVDRFDLWRNGAHALWLKPEGIRMESVGSSGGGRPWSRYPRGRADGQ